jgi:hypothetical protein
LAAASLGVKKIQEDGLVGSSGGLLSFGQVIHPADFHRHELHSFFLDCALLEALPYFCLNLITLGKKTRVAT